VSAQASSSRDLAERIAAFPRWQYRFEFDGGLATPVVDAGRVNRQLQRRRYFFDALLQVTGGSLRGRRVLDLGCNAGFWSLQALDAGAEFVLGVDSVAEQIEQAELVFDARRVDASRYRLERGDALDLGVEERFDVVLCLGLLEQLARPFEMFERMAATGAELIVIDTELARGRASSFEVVRRGDPGEEFDGALALVPTREAVIELAGELGFETVPLQRNMNDYAGLDDYRRLRRLAFICSRGPSLQMLRREGSSPAVARWMTMLDYVRRT
jgi:SAM-dependent methyltransferase